MIKHIEHNVGTVELAKKLNEVIRVLNEGNPNTLPFDPNLLLQKIGNYGIYIERRDYEQAEKQAALIRGMLGLK